MPNRHAFLNRLKHNVLDGGEHFVAVIEPAEYAKIVDLYGRDAADELFIQLGKRIGQVGEGNPNLYRAFLSATLAMTGDSSEGDGDTFLVEIGKVLRSRSLSQDKKCSSH